MCHTVVNYVNLEYKTEHMLSICIVKGGKMARRRTSTRSTGRRMVRRTRYNRVSDTEYTGAWWSGFRAAVYAEDQNITGASNMTAIALAMEGSPIEQNSAGETVAYKRGFKKGQEFISLYRMGKFPDIEDVLAGGSVLENFVEDGASTVADVVSDPLGEISDLLGSIFE